MSYIGNPIISTDFPKDTFSGNSSTTAFTMSIAPASVNAVIVIVSGVVQEPSTYTISGTTLTFSGAPPSGTNNISVRHLGVAGIPNTPSAGSVVTASIADSNVTTAKIADANITQAKLASNVGSTGPSFSAWLSGSQTVSGGVQTKVLFDTEVWDTNNNFASSRFTPTVAGYYQFNMLVNAGAAAARIYCSLYKNGSLYQVGEDSGLTTNHYASGVNSIVYCNGTTDYIEGYVNMSVGQILSSYATNTWFNGCLVRAA